MDVDGKYIVPAQQFLAQIKSVCADFQLHSLDKTLGSINNFAA